MRVFFILIFCVLGYLANGQMPTWPSVYGRSMNETKQDLKAFLNWHNYKAELVESDTSLEVVYRHNSASWLIYATYYFDNDGRCNSLATRRCDSVGVLWLKNRLGDRKKKYRKVGPNKYLSNRKYSMLLEVLDYPSCTYFRETQLNLTEKEYKRLREQGVVSGI